MIRVPYQSGIVRVSSPYGHRILNNSPDDHKGVDLVGSVKTIVAPIEGRIGASTMITDTSNRTWEWGNYIRIDAVDGRSYYFCHLSKRLVKTGDIVKAGDPIGVEGNTGYSFGSHLHFEVRENGMPINPCNLIGMTNVEGALMSIETEKKDKKIKDEVSDFAKDAVEWATENGIVYGDGNGNLMLKDYCTREQMLTFLYRTIRYLEDDGR